MTRRQASLGAAYASHGKSGRNRNPKVIGTQRDRKTRDNQLVPPSIGCTPQEMACSALQGHSNLFAVALSKFSRLNWRDRVRLGEAVFYLALARLALVVIPFKRLAAQLGKQHEQSPNALAQPIQRAQARRIGWAVTTMSRYVPWDSACLAQAVAAKWMLQKRRLPSTLYLGVTYDENKKMLAHAWLRCGQVYVTGAPQHRRFTVVATFAETDQGTTD